MRTSGPHFFVAPDAVRHDRAVLTGDDARHLAVVLRARRGDPVSIADGDALLAQARVASGSPDRVELDILTSVRVPAVTPRITVVHALPKGRKLDDVVQRLTELGADRIVPVHSDRSQVRLEAAKAARALARWRNVALAAAKQSRRVRLPEISEVGEWRNAFEHGARGAVLWEESSRPLRDVLTRLTGAEDVTLGVGPEGGLTAEEVAVSALPDVSLGPTILRTETAALVAASAVFYATGRLG